MAYATFSLIMLFFVTRAYDWSTGNGKYTILANGHCIHFDPTSYNTLLFTLFIMDINKFLQKRCVQLILCIIMSSIRLFMLHRSLYNMIENLSRLPLLWELLLVLHSSLLMSQSWLIQTFQTLLSSLVFSCSSNRL